MCCIIIYYQVWRRLLCQVWGKGKDCKELETWEGWQWHHGQWPLAKGRGRATGGSLSALWWWSCICIDARAVSGTAWCMQDHQPNPFGVVGSHAYIWQQIISTIHFFLSHAVSFSNGITRASIIHPPKSSLLLLSFFIMTICTIIWLERSKKDAINMEIHWPVNGNIVLDTVDNLDQHVITLPRVNGGARELTVDGHDGLRLTQSSRVLHHHLHAPENLINKLKLHSSILREGRLMHAFSIHRCFF